MVKEYYNGDTTYVVCDICGVTLTEIYSPSMLSHQIFFLNDCDHYYWESVGYYCYEFPDTQGICEGVEDVIRDHIFHIDDGGYIYFLVPRQSS